MQSLKKILGPLFPCAYFFVLNLIILSLSRIFLALWQHERVSAVSGWTELFVQGARVDISLLSWVSAGIASLSLLLFWNNHLGEISQKIIRILLCAATSLFIFLELSTPAFLETYDFRPNRLFVEYLIHPKEVFSMLLSGHAFATLCVPVVTGLITWGIWKLYSLSTQNLSNSSIKHRILLLIILAPLLFIGGRSTLGHRPLNPSMVAFSPDSMVNSLVLNSSYSLGFAISQMTREADAAKIYGKMPEDKIISILKNTRGRPESDYTSTQYPTLTQNTASYNGKFRNIVIILMESQGAQFIGTLGGKKLSPNFDQLAKEGWLFENLYCTGTRSVRGIEAVITGFTPTPASAVVKLQKSQSDFFTLANFLKQHGYQSSFIYGGEKHFDNMASFFYGNGFDLIIDEKDYNNPKYTTTWGVSDEDLFDMAHKKFQEFSATNKPFFSLVFTSSNHDPFDVPTQNFNPVNPGQQTRENAAQYADYALGHFFKLAKNSKYWENTIFLIVADHDSRAAGASLIPINNFHIPALIIGNNITPQRDPRLVSQIDLPTTLLSLAGTSGEYPMLGYDLTQNKNPNRAIMQFNNLFAYRHGNELVILQPKDTPKGFLYDPTTGKLSPSENISNQLKETALATALWGSLAYGKKLYPAPKKKED